MVSPAINLRKARLGLRPMPFCETGWRSRAYGMLKRFTPNWLSPTGPQLNPPTPGVAARPTVGPSSIQSSLPFGINVFGYITSEKGVGEAVRSNLRVCLAGGIPHVANSFVDNRSLNVEQLPENFSRQNPYRINLLGVNANELPGVVRQDPKYCEGRYNIGFWNWELSTFPSKWRTSFDYLDEIWVPSRFVQGAIEKIATIPVTCIPLCVDPSMRGACSGTRSQLGIPEDVFVFLFFFDFHSHLERKNPGGLIRAFQQAFGGRKDVLLFIKSSHGSLHRLALHRLKKLARGSNVRIVNQVLPRAMIYSLMTCADAYVSLHRSEGFGLTLSEAMACGKPVIATGYSGNMEFMTPENSFPVRFKMAELAKDHGPYTRGNVWADPDLDHASELMLRLVEDRQLAAEVAERGRVDVMHKLHPSTIAKIVNERLAALPDTFQG